MMGPPPSKRSSTKKKKKTASAALPLPETESTKKKPKSAIADAPKPPRQRRSRKGGSTTLPAMTDGSRARSEPVLVKAPSISMQPLPQVSPRKWHPQQSAIASTTNEYKETLAHFAVLRDRVRRINAVLKDNEQAAFALLRQGNEMQCGSGARATTTIMAHGSANFNSDNVLHFSV
ncbi:hypothetical protein BC828DRAFT_387907 [Blastocladiella britannica]|nr:hypothetical protein BC828DRAFT_387907 [Blastocladiella britannica]